MNNQLDEPCKTHDILCLKIENLKSNLEVVSEKLSSKINKDEFRDAIDRIDSDFSELKLAIYKEIDALKVSDKIQTESISGIKSELASINASLSSFKDFHKLLRDDYKSLFNIVDETHKLIKKEVDDKIESIESKVDKPTNIWGLLRANSKLLMPLVYTIAMVIIYIILKKIDAILPLLFK